VLVQSRYSELSSFACNCTGCIVRNAEAKGGLRAARTASCTLLPECRDILYQACNKQPKALSVSTRDDDGGVSLARAFPVLQLRGQLAALFFVRRAESV
jgi:hypothetical protein